MSTVRFTSAVQIARIYNLRYILTAHAMDNTLVVYLCQMYDGQEFSHGVFTCHAASGQYVRIIRRRRIDCIFNHM